MSNDKLLSEMDRAVLAMPPELAFSDDLARFQYHGRVQALIARIDTHEAEKQAGPVACISAKPNAQRPHRPDDYCPDQRCGLIGQCARARAQAPAPVDGDVRELRKWLNEQPNRPVDRDALARLLHAVENAQPVGEIVTDSIDL